MKSSPREFIRFLERLQGICFEKEVGALILSVAQTLIIFILNLSIVKNLGTKPSPNSQSSFYLFCAYVRTAILALDGMSEMPHSRSWTSSLRAMFLPLINTFTAHEIHYSLQSSADSRIAYVFDNVPGVQVEQAYQCSVQTVLEKLLSIKSLSVTWKVRS